MNTFKVGRCIKKKVDDKQYLMLRLTGKKFPAAAIKDLKARINLAVTEFFASPEEE